jgi:hypothetical protein
MPKASRRIHFAKGDIVQVLSEQEILETLDQNGCFEAVPFMPEMLQFCGKEYRVRGSAHKTCDTVAKKGLSRRLDYAVHLEGVRCTGDHHGGCQASCLIFWKDVWLRKVTSPARIAHLTTPANPVASVETLINSAVRFRDSTKPDDTLYRCQATELRHFTTDLRRWDLQQYLMDLWSGNASLIALIRALCISAFNTLQRWRGGARYPHIQGRVLGKTPKQLLHLEPGELVEVKSKAEILETLDENDRNRGLSFDREMVRFCGKRMRVRHRIERIIDEATGKLLRIGSDCITLDGVICSGELNRFCPRAIYPYWREIWLKRVATEPSELVNIVSAAASEPIASSK